MRRALLVILIYSVCLTAGAGVETTLVEDQSGSCMIRIVHSAAPSDTSGVLVLRSYMKNSGQVMEPCPPDREQTGHSLRLALQAYAAQQLKPFNGIMLGRIMRYPWLQAYLAEQPAHRGKVTRAYHDKLFNHPGFLHEAVQPLPSVLADFNLKIVSASCEKILIDKDGKATDAICWLNVK
ncbi:MAG: hypothetical protein OEZ39_11975 [Gammaproteobacteria bacterium]|nr:hypothetical protein [Gammaproteobacteria bacterium]MDH5652561.1 hypothetical protein [Gammaproteobacteria bacterium]